MSDVPFGFGVPSEHGDESERRDPDPFRDSDNPFAALLGPELGTVMARIGQFIAQGGGPVNWDLAHELARQTVQGGDDRIVTDAERRAVEEAMRLADHWLDEVTGLASGTASIDAWSRAEWVDATLPVWKQLIEPVAGRVVETMSEALPEEMKSAAGPLLGMMRSVGGALFGVQVGQALGSLAGEVVASTDIGLPLGPPGRASLLPVNLAQLCEGLGVAEDEARLYLALREAAHHRLFGHVPWLRAHLLNAVEAYARGIKVDLGRLEQAVGSIDPTNPEALQEAMASGMFEPEETPEQTAALARLETALALVEGWVDTVVDEAAASRLPSAAKLRETLRRRRASGGPAEQTFATLVGLELRPRRLREAATLWQALGKARGGDARDAVWAHPDLMPTADDLDDPDSFVERSALELQTIDETLTPPEADDTRDDGPDEGR